MYSFQSLSYQDPIQNFDTIQIIFDADYENQMQAYEGVHFEPEADLIAIGKNDRKKNRFFFLSSAELQACT